MKRVAGATAATLGGTLGTGVAVWAPATFSDLQRIAILVHGPLGLAVTALGLSLLAEHVRRRVPRATLRWLPFAVGCAATVAWVACTLTGIVLGARALGWVESAPAELHRLAAVAAGVIALAHGLHALARHPESARDFGRGLAVVFVAAGLGATAALPGRTPERSTVVAGGAEAPFGDGVRASRLENLGDASCGEVGCHATLTREHRRSAHATSTRSPQFAATLALLHGEAPERAGFCSGCHHPASASGRPEAEADGLGCLTCHAARETTGEGAFGKRIDLALAPGHLDQLAAAALPGAEGVRARAWLRAVAPAHRRAFSPMAGQDRLCLSCHGLYIPTSDAPRHVASTCVECHMRGQERLPAPEGTADPGEAYASAGESSHLRHIFAGSNVSLPESLGDEEQASLVRRWLTGAFEFGPQIPFWSLGPDGTPLNRARWLHLEIERRADPVPGRPFPVRLATANVGIGHPFPSAPMDLVRVALSGELVDAAGTVRFRVPEGEINLGPRTVATATGEPLEGHRIWEPHHSVGDEALARGRTVYHSLEIPLPPEPDAYPARLVLRWTYVDLDTPFRAFAGLEPVIPEAVILQEAVAMIEPRGDV